MSTPATAKPKRLSVEPDPRNPTWAFTCPLCHKSFGGPALFSHVNDHRYGLWGLKQSDVHLEIIMIIPSGPKETP